MSHYDLIVVIGRFQPVHAGHVELIQKAKAKADNVLVLVGSANRSRSQRNPFSVEERLEMLRGVAGIQHGVYYMPLDDETYALPRWISNVQKCVSYHFDHHSSRRERDAKIAVMGHQKDDTFYLKLFPQWDYLDFENPRYIISSTQVRETWFEGSMVSLLPDNVSDALVKFRETDTFEELKWDYEYIKKYKSAWKDAPYAPTFLTADSVVYQAGHVLLVRRKDGPGRGLLALPGGFIHEYETFKNAAIRELYEETTIDVPPGAMRGYIKHDQLFADPYRSERGRTVTKAYLFDLTNEIERQVQQARREGKKTFQTSMTKVKAADDAKEAMWVDLDDLDPREFFEDHYFIIREMLEHM